MSFIYCLIARKPSIVLCEYSEYDGNFMQISRFILQKGETDNKIIIPYDKYRIHMINENNLIFLSLTEEISDDNAFAFLSDVQRKLLKEFNIDDLLQSNGMALSNFTETLKQYMTYYNTHPYTTKTGDTINELHLAKDAAIANIEKLFERNNKMDIIAKKSENIQGFSTNISAIAENIKKKEQKNKMIIYIVIAVVVVLILLFIIF